MRVSLIATCTIFLLSIQLVAQNNRLTPGFLSAETLLFLNDTETSEAAPKADAKYVYSQAQANTYVNAFIKVDDNFNEAALTQLGVLIGTKAKDIWTIKVPIDQMNALADIEVGIKAIQMDQPIANNMEEARAKTNTDLVHEGVGLAQAYSGKDVVVGIIDIGFDYTHPTFNDGSPDNFRIKRIWEQKKMGTPPAGYNYGNEITDPQDMFVAQSDDVTNSHGTHVAGIAAGNGYGGDGNEYRGVAYESDLVFVGITPAQDQWLNTGMTDIVDGINYIFQHAESEGKPAVANLSWGCSIGPHDGSSLFSQAVNNLTGPGKIFTISAGNNGGNLIHLNKAFSDTDSVLHSVIEFDDRLTEKKTWIDVWGQTNAEFCVQVSTYQGTSETASTNNYCTEDGVIDTYLIGSDNDTCFINLSLVEQEYNGKAHALLDLRSKTNDDISIKVKATSGEVHVWMGYVEASTGYYGKFVTNSIPGASIGNDRLSIGEMACTSSAIAVGAYASKNSFTNISGGNLSYSGYVSTNRICPFSSRGPTSDDRMKPDITAPGMTLASAVSSFDQRYLPGGVSYSNVVHKYTDSNSGRDYYYGESSGTSMSAPMVAGIVALVLEANPFATPQELQDLMAATALTDVYTSSSPTPSIWGPGKIDAHALLQHYAPSSLDELNFEKLKFFPNPTMDDITLDSNEPFNVKITDLVGRQVLLTKNSPVGISLRSLEEGIYIVSVFEGQQLLTAQKVIKL